MSEQTDATEDRSDDADELELADAEDADEDGPQPWAETSAGGDD